MRCTFSSARTAAAAGLPTAGSSQCPRIFARAAASDPGSGSPSTPSPPKLTRDRPPLCTRETHACMTVAIGWVSRKLLLEEEQNKQAQSCCSSVAYRAHAVWKVKKRNITYSVRPELCQGCPGAPREAVSRNICQTGTPWREQAVHALGIHAPAGNKQCRGSHLTFDSFLVCLFGERQQQTTAAALI